MLNWSDSFIKKLGHQAEREMTAFLRAAMDAPGPIGIQGAADAWIGAMESLEWPEDNHERFFRRVTIITVSQLMRGHAFDCTISAHIETRAQIQAGALNINQAPFKKTYERRESHLSGRST